MSSLVSSSLEWLLKRALRYVVQRFLGRVLQNEVRQGRGTTGEKRKTLMMEASFDRPSLSFSFSFLYSPPSPLFMFLSLSFASSHVGRMFSASRAREEHTEKRRRRETRALDQIDGERASKKSTSTAKKLNPLLSSLHFQTPPTPTSSTPTPSASGSATARPNCARSCSTPRRWTRCW